MFWLFGYDTKEYRYYRTYFKHYYKEALRTEHAIYEDIMKANGRPEKEWQETDSNGFTRLYLKYRDGRLIVFEVDANGDYDFCWVEITGTEYQFGKKKIGIGTKKEVVEEAYRNSYGRLYNWGVTEESGYDVEDGYYQLEFYFDEEERVNQISIAKSDNIHARQGWKKKSWEKQ